MNRWTTLTLAPHRLHFLCGMASLLLASGWWAVHLLARYVGTPIWALDLQLAPVWVHSFLMLFVVMPTFMFGFLFTTFPRWMNGPAVPRSSYVATAILLFLAAIACLAGSHAGRPMMLVAAALAAVGLIAGLSALLRVLVDAENVVPHAIVAITALAVGVVAVAGFGYGLSNASDFALHFAVRTALWGFLLPVFFAVCHRMIPFFSQNAISGYAAWRPTWILVAVVTLAYARLLLGTAGTLGALPFADAALLLLTVTCAVRWTSFRARSNPLLWTLYAAFSWLPVAMALQAARDTGFALTGEWMLGRAPVHALGIGYFGGMLVAMVTRVTLGHSGRALAMDRAALACFVGVQVAAAARVFSEVVTAPAAVRDFLLGSMILWLLACGMWAARYGGIYLSPRSDGKPG